ncbi:MAG: 23S rRNA (adenine(2503)-C(2))-methyltransferase RlmN [bacterium]|nr:23S rRNA (adenine(2503)-C(2))-methyltransferase RlmN [bacterium]
MDLNKLREILKDARAFRLKQIKKAVFQDLIENWDQISTLPKNLREQLDKDCPISELKEEKTLTSKDDQATKILFKLNDGSKVESVLMRHLEERITVCVSSQAGCSIGCKFCATGLQGLKRNLSSGEIVDQILFFARLLKKTNEKVSSVVFMGMGEPFLNYDNVLEAIKTLNDKDGFNLGARHISISTAGIIEGIEKLNNEKLQVNLAVSLHAPDDELRTELMPINKVYPIKKLLAAVDDYIKKTGRKVMFEYLMIDGVNDSPEQAEALGKLLVHSLLFGNQKNFSQPDQRYYFVNLISFNSTGHSEFKPSPGWKIKNFKQVLDNMGVDVTQRYRFGREIKAACGQLAGEN